MPVLTGTHDISSLRSVRFQSAAEFGLDTIQQVLANDLAVHNRLVQDLVGGLADLTTDRQRIYGTSASGEMVEVDEYGRAPTQRIAPGATVGFPLRMFQYALGWNQKWMQLHTPAEMAEAVIAAEQAHLKMVQREVKKAFFLSANYTFNDFLVDKIDLSVKRLINADSSGIPNGPNGESFDGATHTHYNASPTLDTTALTALIDDVVEHGHGGAVKVAFNRGNEAAVKALSGFKEYADPRLIYVNTDHTAQTLDLSRLDDRAIGIYGAAEIWIKPWVPASYAFCWDAAGPKPLAFRQRNNEGLQGLRLAASLETFPLYADYLEAEFGIGVWNRTNGAVLYFASGTYADPTIS